MEGREKGGDDGEEGKAEEWGKGGWPHFHKIVIRRCWLEFTKRP